jgi:hypothetical protein
MSVTLDVIRLSVFMDEDVRLRLLRVPAPPDSGMVTDPRPPVTMNAIDPGLNPIPLAIMSLTAIS